MTDKNKSKDLVEKLIAENKRLREENDLKTGWISLISHDFKEAFSSLLLLLRTLESESISEADFFKLLPRVRLDAEKNLQTITDTGAWIKSQSNGFRLQISEIYAGELFAHLKKEFQKNLEEKQLQLIFQGDENIMIRTDRLLLSFILRKITDNAVKYSHPGGVIFFEADQKENDIIFSITDQGIGMDEKQVESIFTFDSAVFHGTCGERGGGLSLNIVKNLIHLIDGTIKIQSVKAEGSIVSIFLGRKAK